MKITAVLVVDEIESSLPSGWNASDLTKLVEVPDGERLGFVVLAREGAELMLQTKDSVREERTTFYGMREIGVFDPGGNIVIFAKRV